MLQTLLIPVDFTIHTARALNYAIQIAQRSGACITVLSSNHKQSEADDNLLHLLEVADELAHHHFSDVIQKIHPRKALAQVKARYHYLPKITAELVIAEVKANAYDMLVVSAKKKAFFNELLAGNFWKDVIRHLFFGNTLETFIATHLPCPLLIVPETCQYAHIEHIMYATNLEANDYSLQKLHTLTSAINAFTHFIHVINEETRSYNKRYKAFCQKVDAILGHKKYEVVELNQPDVEEALAGYLRQNRHINVIAMVERVNKAHIDNWLLNSLTREMAYNAPIPVLILHDTADEL